MSWPSSEEPFSSVRLFEEESLEVFGEKVGTLSVCSRALNESTNVVGNFRHKYLDTPDQSCQKHSRKEHLSG